MPERRYLHCRAQPGSRLALLGLLEAFGLPTPPSWNVNWVAASMTLGHPSTSISTSGLSCSEAHIRCASLRHRSPGATTTIAAIPIGFELDAVRRWFDERDAGPTGVTWRDVFEFDEQHDFGFARSPFPGKAGVDYWDDDEVFGHFIQSVVAQGDRA